MAASERGNLPAIDALSTQDFNVVKCILHDRNARRRFADLVGSDLLARLQQKAMMEDYLRRGNRDGSKDSSASRKGSKYGRGGRLDGQAGSAGRRPTALDTLGNPDDFLSGGRRHSSGGDGNGDLTPGGSRRDRAGFGEDGSEDDSEEARRRRRGRGEDGLSDLSTGTGDSARDRQDEDDHGGADGRSDGSGGPGGRRGSGGKDFGEGSDYEELDDEAKYPYRLFTIKATDEDGEDETGKGLFPGKDVTDGLDGSGAEDGSEGGEDDASPLVPFTAGSTWMTMRLNLAEEFRKAIREAWDRVEGVAAAEPSHSSTPDGEAEGDSEPLGSWQERAAEVEKAFAELGPSASQLGSPRSPARSRQVSPQTSRAGSKTSRRGTPISRQVSRRVGAAARLMALEGELEDDDVRSELVFERMLLQGAMAELGNTTSRLQRKRYRKQLQERANADLARNRSRQRWQEHMESCSRSLGPLSTLDAFAERYRAELGLKGKVQESVC